MSNIEHGEGLQDAIDTLADAYKQRPRWDYEGRVVEAMARQDTEIARLTRQLAGAVEENERLRNLTREAHASLASGRGVEALEYLRAAPRPRGGSS